ncbi:MAG: transcription repressor NadR [Lachnospiraceae bacterium]|nr:transcription repressor NadR [Lachnospiraceae bacterium]
MSGESRREKILTILKDTTEPISGSALAKEFGVSRQVIVQDIALIRAINKNIMATNKGYILYTPQDKDTGVRRVVHVKHDNSQMEDELTNIVDFGGRVLDVFVDHPIYGQIMVDLLINNRQDVADFIEKIKSNRTTPLMGLTDGVHYHTITAASEEVLDVIENALKKRGYLI